MKPLGVYIHIPFCKRKCAYCDFVSYPDSEHIFVRYTDALVKEMELYAPLLQKSKIDTVFIGGGTPPLLPPGLIRQISDAVRTHSKNDIEEFTIEANPESLTEPAAQIYAEIGINRLSLGLQTHEDDILKRIGRRHDYATFLRAYELACEYIGNVNVDLMLGLPGQSVSGLRESVQRVIALAPQHVSVYSLKLEPDTPMAGWYGGADDETDREMFHTAVALLSRAGYSHYETSNFALPGFACRHNLKYWTGQEYLGLGASAHSYLIADAHVRSANTEYLEEYIAQIAAGRAPVAQREVLSAADIADEYVMLRLRLAEGIPFADYFSRFGRHFEDDHEQAINWALENGLVTVNGEAMRPTLRGFDLQNTLIRQFMKKI